MSECWGRGQHMCCVLERKDTSFVHPSFKDQLCSVCRSLWTRFPIGPPPGCWYYLDLCFRDTARTSAWWVGGQKKGRDQEWTQISCPNCEEKARGLHHNPTPPNQTLHPSQWAVLKRDPPLPLGETALLFTKPWDSRGEEMTQTIFHLIKGKTKTQEVEQK